MKTRFLITVFLLVSCLGFAQDKKTLQVRMQKMYTHTVNNEYAQLVDMTYPKLFEIVPKDKMLAAMQGMMKGNGYTMIILNTPPNFTYGEIKKIDGGSYCIVKHDLLMKMIFDEAINTEDGKAMIENFKKAMETDEVTFDEKEHSFLIKKRSEVIAIADKLTKNEWTFVNKSKSKLMTKVFSENVIKQLGLQS